MAKRVTASEATIGRWIKGTVGAPEPRTAVELARAYGASPLAALMAAGYLTQDELDSPAESPRLLQLTAFTDLELAQELVRRIEAGGEHPDLEAPIDSLPAPAVGGEGDDPSTKTDAELQARYRLAADHSDAEQDLDERTP